MKVKRPFRVAMFSIKFLLSITICLLFTTTVFAQEESASELTDKAMELYQQEKYSEAFKMLKKALEVNKKNLGPDHPDVSDSMFYLAQLYSSQGKYTEAEPLYKQALVIRVKHSGPDDSSVANILESMAYFYKVTGNSDEEIKVRERLEKIRSN
ncbi:MAG: tetratricopeptide repeat protein [Candidatus Omnitrophica bacterium]|nr:tetratricopeptide repeat protein [Candidatus Omnitrophota bacterium]